MDIKQVMMIKYVLQFSYKHHITFRNMVLPFILKTIKFKIL